MLKSTNRKFGTVVGITAELKDIDNTYFTDYVSDPNNLRDLIQFARHLDMDPTRAEDLVQDVWISYRKNEENGECYDTSAGHDVYISVEEAVKARMKLMAHNYQADFKHEVLFDYTEPANDARGEDDKLHAALMNKVHDVTDSLDKLIVDEDLKDSMMHFVACTADCKVPGIALLSRLDYIVDMVGNKKNLTGLSHELLADILHKGDDVKESLKEILGEYCKDKDIYLLTLGKVREEYTQCQELMKRHNMEVRLANNTASL